MQNYKEQIEFSDFILGLRAIDKKQIIQNIAWKIGRQTNADMTWIAEQFLLSEEKQSSGIGDGVAILHLKSTPLTKPYIMIAKLDRPVEFDSIDARAVDVVCAVLSPQMDGNLHLRRLSRVTRILLDPFIQEQIRMAETEEDLAAIFNSENPCFMAA